MLRLIKNYGLHSSIAKCPSSLLVSTYTAIFLSISRHFYSEPFVYRQYYVDEFHTMWHPSGVEFQFVTPQSITGMIRFPALLPRIRGL